MIKEQIKAVKIQLETINNMMEFIPNAKFIVFFVVGFFVSWFITEWLKKLFVLISVSVIGGILEFVSRKKLGC